MGPGNKQGHRGRASERERERERRRDRQKEKKKEKEGQQLCGHKPLLCSTRTATDFGGAGVLTVERREEMDAAVDALRNLKLPLKKLLKSAGGKPDGTEAAESPLCSRSGVLLPK